MDKGQSAKYLCSFLISGTKSTCNRAPKRASRLRCQFLFVYSQLIALLIGINPARICSLAASFNVLGSGILRRVINILTGASLRNSLARCLHCHICRKLVGLCRLLPLLLLLLLRLLVGIRHRLLIPLIAVVGLGALLLVGPIIIILLLLRLLLISPDVRCTRTTDSRLLLPTPHVIIHIEPIIFLLLLLLLLLLINICSPTPHVIIHGEFFRLSLILLLLLGICLGFLLNVATNFLFFLLVATYLLSRLLVNITITLVIVILLAVILTSLNLIVVALALIIRLVSLIVVLSLVVVLLLIIVLLLLRLWLFSYFGLGATQIRI